nr:hypothetical protein [uncultured Campylobacter sp.]
MKDVREEVKEYYSKITNENEGEMETSICACGAESLPGICDRLER